MPTDILLATLNAKYIHAAFGLRYLMANLGELQPRAALAEFDINQRPVDIAEAILARAPRLLGLGVYIWNVRPTTELVAILKRLRPDLIIVLGGPEVSHETEGQEIVQLADHVVTGEADLAFAELCRQCLDPNAPRPPHLIPAPLPDVARLVLPYDLYDDRDVAHRVIYVEVSRGCPFTCEFCLSSLDIPVRPFPLTPFLAAMERLLERGVRHFKFVDRTFNLHLPTSTAILEFFLARWRPGLFLHFEMVPDRLPEGLRGLIARFPPGTLQFEVGIQTLNPEVEERIRRRQNHTRMEDNFRWLRHDSGVHVHADLIAGLPGESLDSFGAGFDRLVALQPQEIQVGLLKRLRGTPLGRHDEAFAMRFNPHPPYEILENRDLDFRTLARLRRFAGFWDLFANSGRFSEALPHLWRGGSPFVAFLAFSDALHERDARPTGMALTRQFEMLAEHFSRYDDGRTEAALNALARDYARAGRSDRPAWHTEASPAPAPSSTPPSSLPQRQRRHLAAASGGSPVPAATRVD